MSYHRHGKEHRRTTHYREAERRQAEELLDRVIAERLDGAPRAWRLTAAEMRLLRGPIVYVLTRGQRTLYVGQSRHGLVRPLASRHHVLGQLALDGREELCVYHCDSAWKARALEAELILRLQPSLNAVRLAQAADA
jgi:hypothetical protein